MAAATPLTTDPFNSNEKKYVHLYIYITCRRRCLPCNIS